MNIVRRILNALVPHGRGATDLADEEMQRATVARDEARAAMLGVRRRRRMARSNPWVQSINRGR